MNANTSITLAGRLMDAKDRAAEKVGYGVLDAIDKNARLLERDRCGQMLAEYIAQGRTDQETVAYAVSLLRTDY